MLCVCLHHRIRFSVSIVGVVFRQYLRVTNIAAGSWCLTGLYWGAERNRRVEEDICVVLSLCDRGDYQSVLDWGSEGIRKAQRGNVVCVFVPSDLRFFPCPLSLVLFFGQHLRNSNINRGR